MVIIIVHIWSAYIGHLMSLNLTTTCTIYNIRKYVSICKNNYIKMTNRNFEHKTRNIEVFVMSKFSVLGFKASVRTFL